MSLLYLFIFIFVPVYLVLTTKEKLFKPNLSLLIAFIVTSSSLIVYDIFLSGGSWERMNQKQSLEAFLDGDLQTRSDLRGDIRELFILLIEKPDIEAGELYILARKLKNANEYILAEDVYEEIYDRYGDELDGDIIAEYAQVLFISKGRKFNDSVYVLLKEALLNSPNNPLGTYITRTQLETLANIFRKHNCIVISDEIYLNLAFEERAFRLYLKRLQVFVN